MQYAVVGGMPDVVQTFIDTKRMDAVLRIQRDIVRSYEDDMVKYAEKKDKSRLEEFFQSIPKQLSKGNKKFQYSVMKKGSTAAGYMGSLQWIEDAGIISRCYNFSITELPLDGNAIEDVFKIYMRDCGLFVSTLVDVKAAAGNAKSTKTILRHPEKYHVHSAIKLGNYNVGRLEQILTLPLYMAFLLRES